MSDDEPQVTDDELRERLQTLAPLQAYVAYRVCAGESIKEIRRALNYRGDRRVYQHLANVYEKLGLTALDQQQRRRSDGAP